MSLQHVTTSELFEEIELRTASTVDLLDLLALHKRADGLKKLIDKLIEGANPRAKQ